MGGTGPGDYKEFPFPVLWKEGSQCGHHQCWTPEFKGDVGKAGMRQLRPQRFWGLGILIHRVCMIFFSIYFYFHRERLGDTGQCSSLCSSPDEGQAGPWRCQSSTAGTGWASEGAELPRGAVEIPSRAFQGLARQSMTSAAPGTQFDQGLLSSTSTTPQFRGKFCFSLIIVGTPEAPPAHPSPQLSKPSQFPLLILT